MSKPSVDIVVCVHNALSHTKKCFESIQKNSKNLTKLIIIDDCSNKRTRKYLINFCNENRSRVLISNNDQLYYTKSANIGLQNSKSDYVILLNSDTIVSEGWIDSLLKPFEVYEKVGLVGPLSNAASFQSIPKVYDGKGHYKINKLPSNFTLSKFAKYVDSTSNKSYPTIDFLNGFCMAIKKDVLSDIGYLDESSFPLGYAEETDLCFRARQKGYSIRVADNCYIYHAKSKSYGKDKRDILAKEGRQKLIDKHTKAYVDKAYANNRENSFLKEIRCLYDFSD